MKRLLFLALLLLAVPVKAATPSFASFNTNDFIIAPSLLSPKTISINGTLGLTNLYVTNIYATNITVNNLYATNFFTTNFYSFSTNTFVTNLTVVELTVVTNITIGGTNVAVINPTDLHYPYRASSNSFGDGAIIHIDANTAGVDEMDIGTLVVTNLMTGGVVISDTSGILTNVPVGTGVLNNDGANNFTWGPAGTTINPTDGYLPYRSNATTFADSPILVDTNKQLYVSVPAIYPATFTDPGSSDFVSITSHFPAVSLYSGGSQTVVSYVPNLFDIQSPATADWTYSATISGTNRFKVAASSEYSGTGTKALTDDGTYKAFAGSSTTINPTDYYIPFRTNATTFLNSPLYVTSTNVALDSQLIFGPGTTNVMYRSGGNLVYTNALVGNDGPGIVVQGPTGDIKLSAIGNVGQVHGTAGVGLFDAITAGNEVRWFGKYLAPTSGTDSQLGADTATTLKVWGGVNSLTNTIYGFKDTVSTNYSRLAISHSGTNGSAILNSQANGTAGPARPIDIQVGGTNVMVYKADRQEFYNDGAKKWTMISGNLYPESANDIGTSLNPIGYLYAGGAQIGSCLILSGAGSPEGVKTAPVGSLYMRSDGGANTSLYVKETGSGNTGWVGK